MTSKTSTHKPTSAVAIAARAVWPDREVRHGHHDLALLGGSTQRVYGWATYGRDGVVRYLGATVRSALWCIGTASYTRALYCA